MQLARCLTRACPVRFLYGGPRLCGWCAADGTAPVISRASGFSVMYEMPGDRGGGDG